MRKGVYVLIAKLSQDDRIRVGKLGEIDFKEGYYAYVGSALGSLEGRVKRHFRREKKMHWHIDYLLSSAKPLFAMLAETNKRLECRLASELSKRLAYVEGFGSTDCKCRSHLFYSDNLNLLLKSVRWAFRENDLKSTWRWTPYQEGLM